jgi:tRNA A-37 threonylcarbamoyl transferase component Bud32
VQVGRTANSHPQRLPRPSLGGFEIERRLATGASGRVYLARQTTSAGRPVALKRLRAPADDQHVARLRREGEVLAALDHPHIVRVYELVPDGDGVAIAMQFAPGGSLADRLAHEGPMTPAQVKTMLVLLADALASAHRNGVLHRDVKPANILFTSDGEPLLSDFGLAHWADAPSLTREGLAVGTAGYLDPRVAEGHAPDERSDVYSLAVVGYHTLAGKPPFSGTNLASILRASDRADHQPLAEAAPTVPAPLASVIERAMARVPDHRYQSASEFAAALRTAGAGAAARRLPPRPPAPPTLRERLPRRLVPLTVGAVVACAALLVITQARGSHRGAPRPPARAAAARCTPSDAGAPVVHDAEGCSWSAVVRGNEVELRSNGMVPVLVGLGEQDDVAVVGDWSCRGGPAPGAYRPSTGEVFLFDGWPRPGLALDTASVSNTSIVGGSPVVRRTPDGCDRVAITKP